ncbi:STAS domain-containing protein [Lentzea sp. NPDC042327]|uniref:STAS domain-containing protein n=1 Tax=Lentzea sp. NPDC042327 TaxID=3154801 RepID=UPI0033C6D917
MNDFSVTVRTVAAGVVLTIRGDLDAHTSPGVLARTGELSLSRGQLLVVDLSGLRFCDSSGISAFIAARNLAVGAQADVVLVAVPRQVLRVLDVVGLGALFTVRSSVEDALSGR